MLDVALFLAFGAAWVVSMFFVRRRVVRDVVAHRMTIGTAAVILGLMWFVVPLPVLLWWPDALAPILFSSALLFVVTAGTTVAMARMMGWR